MKVETPKTMKVVTDEKQMGTTNDELLEELKIKQIQLIDKNARLKGGISPILKKEVLAIDTEIRIRERTIRINQLQMEDNFPLTPYYPYEKNEEYIKLKNEERAEYIRDLQKDLDRVKEQKETIYKEIEELKIRISMLQKLLDSNKSKKAK